MSLRERTADISHAAVLRFKAEKHIVGTLKRALALRGVQVCVRIVFGIIRPRFCSVEIALLGVIYSHPAGGSHVAVGLSVGVPECEACQIFGLSPVDIGLQAGNQAGIQLNATIGVVVSVRIARVLGARVVNAVAAVAAVTTIASIVAVAVAIIAIVCGGVAGAKAVVLLATVFIGISEVLAAGLAPKPGELAVRVGVGKTVVVNDITVRRHIERLRQIVLVIIVVIITIPTNAICSAAVGVGGQVVCSVVIKVVINITTALTKPVAAGCRQKSGDFAAQYANAVRVLMGFVLPISPAVVPFGACPWCGEADQTEHHNECQREGKNSLFHNKTSNMIKIFGCLLYEKSVVP